MEQITDNDDIKLKLIYIEAYNYLKEKVGEDVLKKELNHYYEVKPESIDDVFKQMVRSLKNKQGFRNFIAKTDELKPVLFNFNLEMFLKTFMGDWKILFYKFKEKFGDEYKMDINNKRNAWVTYSKGIISGSKFLSRFNSLKDFDDYVKSFSYNEFTIANLPMELKKEIFGFGFPLACDFLKELGYVEYGKPDVHLKDIFFELKLVESRDDYEIFKKMVRIGKIVNQDTVVVDKVFWLIGYHNFKSEFIECMKDKLKNDL